MNYLTNKLATSASQHTILKPVISLISVTRGKQRAPAQSQRTGRQRQWLGFTVPLGSFVYERDVFLKQRGLKFHPGLNCALDARDNAIHALTDGVIAISTEKFVPDWSNEFVEKHYAGQEGTMMIRYVHVLPVKQPKVFKLVELI